MEVTSTNHVILGCSLQLLLVVGTAGGAPQVATCLSQPGDAPTIDPRFCIRPQPNAPAHLELVKVTLNGPNCAVVLVLHNDSVKSIAGYDVEHLADYERVGEVWSSLGRSGNRLRPGAEVTIHDRWGFSNGLRTGTPVGELKLVQFGIEDVTFLDGSTWHEPDSFYSQQLRKLRPTRPNKRVQRSARS